MTNLKAILFDVDGTLSHTEDAHRAAFNDTFQAEGLDWHWDHDLYRRLLSVTGGRERIRFFIDTKHPNLKKNEGEQGLGDFVSRLHRDKTRRYGDTVASGRVRFRSGVARLIGEARSNGLRLAIATTTGRANVEKLLSENTDTRTPFDDQNIFEVIGASESAAKKKPAPDVYLSVLQQLMLPPEACIAIEDSHNGLRAALGAGIPTVITTSPYTEDDDFSGARAVVNRLGESNRPFRILHGDPLNKTCVDLELLRHWHSQNG
ncbi:MAG: HAD-IA family hydrolase [Rhodospirillales bacterium]|nr:HAD-IA family hydrolase [Rhodospirillales bacterium]